MHWHLDYFRGHCEMIAGLPIRTSLDDAECALADAVRGVAEWDVLNLDPLTATVKSHLFGMAENPIHNKAFMDVVEHYRMNMLDELINR